MEKTTALELDSMARGAVRERFDHAMLQAMENILDPNTKATGTRRVTITLDMKPNEDRDQVLVSANVQTKLQPRAGVGTLLLLGQDIHGSVEFKELAPGQKPGQGVLDGTLPEGVHRLDDARKAGGE